MAGPLRPTPPPSLIAFGTLERWKKEVPKKVIFSLMAGPSPPLLMARPLKEDFFMLLPLKGKFTFFDIVILFSSPTLLD